MSFFEELKRRNVFRVGIAYAIASWLLLWPPLDFANPGNPALSYQTELINVMIELGDFETAIILLEKNMGFDGGYVFTQFRARKSENAIAFYCDPRVRSLYEKYNIPALENESVCD